jgi:methyl-accepting chemotaxis protein
MLKYCKAGISTSRALMLENNGSSYASKAQSEITSSSAERTSASAQEITASAQALSGNGEELNRLVASFRTTS